MLALLVNCMCSVAHVDQGGGGGGGGGNELCLLVSKPLCYAICSVIVGSCSARIRLNLTPPQHTASLPFHSVLEACAHVAL